MAVRRVPRKNPPKPRRPARGAHQELVVVVLGSTESAGAVSFDPNAFDVDAFDPAAFFLEEA